MLNILIIIFMQMYRLLWYNFQGDFNAVCTRLCLWAGMENYMSVKINSYKGRSIRPVYKERIKKDEYSNAIDRICNRYKLGHIKQNESGREYKNRMNKLFSDDVIQSMKKYSHHGRTSLFGHSVHVSYYNIPPA